MVIGYGIVKRNKKSHIVVSFLNFSLTSSKEEALASVEKMNDHNMIPDIYYDGVTIEFDKLGGIEH